MDFEFMRIYTELRTAKMSFHQFMDFASALYAQGHQNGVAQANTRACLERAARTSSEACPQRLEYENVF